MFLTIDSVSVFYQFMSKSVMYNVVSLKLHLRTGDTSFSSLYFIIDGYSDV